MQANQSQRRKPHGKDQGKQRNELKLANQKANSNVYEKNLDQKRGFSSHAGLKGKENASSPTTPTNEKGGGEILVGLDSARTAEGSHDKPVTTTSGNATPRLGESKYDTGFPEEGISRTPPLIILWITAKTSPQLRGMERSLSNFASLQTPQTTKLKAQQLAT